MRKGPTLLVLVALALTQGSTFIFPLWVAGAPAVTSKFSIRDLDRRIAIDPTNSDLYLARAKLHASYFDFDESITDFTKAISLKPSADAYWERGKAHLELAHLDQAAADFDMATKLDPKLQHAWFDAGSLAAKLHHFDKANKAFSQVVEMNPKYYVARAHRAEMFLEMHKPADAIMDLEICVKNDSDKHGTTHAILGQAYMDTNQYQKAVEALTIALARNPISPKAHELRARAYEKLGQPELAKKDCQDVKSTYSDFYDDTIFQRKL